mmetsp:Transcript_13965/g.21121  ORF Transcript_13965/g.21121 Transcript_13965/m.21121 type:complete len:923 (-) Transcript_13965:317-3085(-)|eukprot:CAMPEP_0167765346 /NCGR_PEP_ID=MMETSP0110_2-20121227/14624_1 /TAXON_ID=629695 /ORGANISM="Gymnochlora sp., Strain CCMP2014" /LENGTH=922 /DNA_ID=CAMNT_0007653025 /DNA_START=142 /DNA_END=2910 /DNA_ORIENTATION=+
MQSARGEAEKALKQVLEMLKASLQPDMEVQSKVYKKFESLRTHSEFNICLAYIFSNVKGVDLDTRTQAGLILKGNLAMPKVYAAMPEGVRRQIKETVLRSIGDSNMIVRKTVGSILSAIAGVEKCDGWGTWLVILSRNLDNPNALVQDGAICVVETLIEDSCETLAKRYPKEINIVISKLTTKMKSNIENIRRAAVCSIGHLVQKGLAPESKELMDSYVGNLLLLSSDMSTKVLTIVCCAFTALLESGSPAFKKKFQDGMKCMLKLATHENELVRYNACEFWSTLLHPENIERSDWLASEMGLMKQGSLAKALGPHMKMLVPTLLKAMAYTKNELAMMGDEKDSHVPDKSHEVKPRSSKVMERKFGSFAQARKAGNGGDDCEWSLRKSSAHSLDRLAQIMHSDLLPVLLPLINTLLKHNDWVRRESGVLALGAVASGCTQGINKHLGEIFVFLMNLSKDPRALIRRITCWTLSRYATNFISTDKKYMRPLLTSLLDRMVDGNKKVQLAACSAIMKLYDTPSGTALAIEFLDPVLTKLAVCLTKYQQVNMSNLYDCIAVLATKSSGKGISQPKYLEVLVPKMLQNWSKMEPGNYGLYALIECLSSIALASGKAFQPYAKVIFPQCIKLVQMNLRNLKYQRRTNESKVKEKEESKDEKSSAHKFEGVYSIICCVELAGSIYRGSGHLTSQLADPKAILQTLYDCMTDEDPRIRQCAMAWLGDITCVTPRFIGAYLPNFINTLIANLDAKHPNICFNAAWAVGEGAVRIGPRAFGPFVRGIMAKLIPIVTNSRSDGHLRHNVALTISRLGLVCPNEVSEHLQHFGPSWCQNLIGIEQQKQAELAYRGLCNIVSKRPHALTSKEAFATLCDTIASCGQPSEDLHRIMKNLLHSYKAMLRNRWPDLFGACNPELRYHLTMVYDLHMP